MATRPPAPPGMKTETILNELYRSKRFFAATPKLVTVTSSEHSEILSAHAALHAEINKRMDVQHEIKMKVQDKLQKILEILNAVNTDEYEATEANEKILWEVDTSGEDTEPAITERDREYCQWIQSGGCTEAAKMAEEQEGLQDEADLKRMDDFHEKVNESTGQGTLPADGGTVKQRRFKQIDKRRKLVALELKDEGMEEMRLLQERQTCEVQMNALVRVSRLTEELRNRGLEPEEGVKKHVDLSGGVLQGWNTERDLHSRLKITGPPR